MKIYELAKELGLSVREMMECVERLGIASPRSHFHRLSEENANSVRRHVLRSAVSLDSSLDSEPEIEAPPVLLPRRTTQVLVRKGKKGVEKRSLDSSNPLASPPLKILGAEVRPKPR